ncbi:MAG: abortive infection family protein [Chloroflexi bacterium]|nr:abortive infection family protein [Chloroflexota bacterium]
MAANSLKFKQRILTLNRVVIDTFDDYRWQELGILTNELPMIENHRYLLRSLRWGDDDYSGHSLRTLRKIVGDDDTVLNSIEEFVGVEEWLKKEEPDTWRAMYGNNTSPELEVIEEVATRLDIWELNRHAGRIRRGLREDPEQAIGSSKELLETVFKSIVSVEGEKANQETTALVKEAWQKLDLDADGVLQGAPGRETIRRTLSNLGQIVQGVSEVRNLYGTGHGRYKSKELEIVHARLVVNAAITLATYLLEVSENVLNDVQKDSSDNATQDEGLPW